jgi:hypothetical protein
MNVAEFSGFLHGACSHLVYDNRELDLGFGIAPLAQDHISQTPLQGRALQQVLHMCIQLLAHMLLLSPLCSSEVGMRASYSSWTEWIKKHTSGSAMKI